MAFRTTSRLTPVICRPPCVPVEPCRDSAVSTGKYWRLGYAAKTRSGTSKSWAASKKKWNDLVVVSSRVYILSVPGVLESQSM